MASVYQNPEDAKNVLLNEMIEVNKIGSWLRILKNDQPKIKNEFFNSAIIKACRLKKDMRDENTLN